MSARFAIGKIPCRCCATLSRSVGWHERASASITTRTACRWRVLPASRQHFPEFIDVGNLVWQLRLFKSPAEIDLLRRCARIRCTPAILGSCRQSVVGTGFATPWIGGWPPFKADRRAASLRAFIPSRS